MYKIEIRQVGAKFANFIRKVNQKTQLENNTACLCGSVHVRSRYMHIVSQ